MKTLACLLFGLVILSTSLRAQDETDSLDPETFEFETDLIDFYSSGWFPTPPASQAVMFSGGSDGWLNYFVERARDFRSTSFAPTKYPFSSSDPFGEDEERTILQPNSDEEVEDEEYPERSFSNYDLIYKRSFSFPLMLSGALSYRISNGLLYTHDASRSYLTLGGTPQNFKEVGVLHLKQHMLGLNAGIELPIYGVFLGMEASSISSYYYAKVGYTGYYSAYSRATQYSQIANAKEAIRYVNGQDTLQLFHGRLPNENDFRGYLDLALGWRFSLAVLPAEFELYAMLPQNSVLSDADWRQYYGGLRFNIGYQWFGK